MKTQTTTTNTTTESMFVINRLGNKEKIDVSKIQDRLSKLADQSPYPLCIDTPWLAIEVISRMKNGMTTSELDHMAAYISESKSTRYHPDYSRFAWMLEMSNIYKNLEHAKLLSFSAFIKACYNHEVETFTKRVHMPKIRKDVMEYVEANKELLDKVTFEAMDYKNHKSFCTTFMGLKILQRSYLKVLEKKFISQQQQHDQDDDSSSSSAIIKLQIFEHPVFLAMRVALELRANWEKKEKEVVGDDVINVFHSLIHQEYVHATPTLFNSSTPRPQLASCFLGTVADDLTEQMQTIQECAQISKYVGGIGLNLHDIRAKGDPIVGTDGISNGMIPYIKCLEALMNYVDQGGQKRKGSMALYLEPWHTDIEMFVDLRLATGNPYLRAPDINIGLWIPDLFMERVILNQSWTLFSPFYCPDLSNCYGDEFRKSYLYYEKHLPDKFKVVVDARELMRKIITSQIETGQPYMLYKDHCNNKSNQKHYGTLRCSNLCTEILEYNDTDETAVCNLATLILPSYLMKITQSGGGSVVYAIDFEKLAKNTKELVRNLNNVIDRNYYPTPQTEKSNKLHRPIGIGVQGLHDIFLQAGISFDHEIAQQWNLHIFETIYYSALEESCNIAQEKGKPYPTFTGSPLSNGMFQHDMWVQERIQLEKMIERLQVQIVHTPPSQFTDDNQSPVAADNEEQQHMIRLYTSKVLAYKNTEAFIANNTRYSNDFVSQLKEKVKTYGVYNSLLIAPPPTASTSRFAGVSEGIEPRIGVLYKERLLSGDFSVIIPSLVQKLMDCNLWNEETYEAIVAANGMLSRIKNEYVPSHIKNIYKTAFEIDNTVLIRMAAVRGHFIDQSQSFNLFIESPTQQNVYSIHLYGWVHGLKTGMYYLRSCSAVEASKTTIDSNATQKYLITTTNTTITDNVNNGGGDKKTTTTAKPQQQQQQSVCSRRKKRNQHRQKNDQEKNDHNADDDDDVNDVDSSCLACGS